MGNGGLTTKQTKAVEAFTSGKNCEQAAKAAGVHVNTIYTWKKQPAFRDALKEAERNALQTVTGTLLGLAQKATGTLENVMDSAAYPSTRIRAADIVLGRLLQTRELLALEERIVKLEEMVNEQKSVGET